MPLIDAQRESPRSFLDEVYRSLGYDKGSLLEATDQPNSETNENWLEKGDWLVLARKVGAEKVFFVKNDPVLVFCVLQNSSDNEQLLLEKFRRVWCMSRPKFLFIALPGELRLYRLDRVPTRDAEVLQREQQIEIVKKVAEVAEKLYDYRRENVESGKIYENERFSGIDQRADKRLIQDLKTVRKLLLAADLKPEHAHALIGRSIFIRYLEDRGVIDHKYFEIVAQEHSNWKEILLQEPERPDLAPGSERRRYYRVLLDKDFTYALFKKLANDFNGDMFPEDKEEEESVTKAHLQLLHDFLLGETNTIQPHLFLWAYDFELIPIELISSIYEEFYHKENVFNFTALRRGKRQDDVKTHYTPSVLVEYVLSNLLTSDRLATNPKILDPACGSGIFLVESFRRIVRYKILQRKGKKLSCDELCQTLKEQIKGIEINDEATHVAAFSLYLALLHYQEPPDIRTKRLPHLIYKEGQLEDEDHYNVLFNRSAFALLDEEREQIGESLTLVLNSKEREEYVKLHGSQEVLPLNPHSFDIITGNPPWGFETGATDEIRDAQRHAKQWCKYFDWQIGDDEPSQAFIARCLSLLKPDGDCGLLVPTGVFFKHHENSKKFRQRWLEETTIKTIVNFAHVRHAFFNMDANAPFAFVQFSSQLAPLDHWINYWSVKKTEMVDKIQAIVLGQPDIRRVKQLDLENNDFLWKVYWWGNHHDATLIKILRLNTTLDVVARTRDWPRGLGFKDPSSNPDANVPSDWLMAYGTLPTRYFKRYGAIDPADLEPISASVHRRGDKNIQSGWRLLIGQGITQANNANGKVEVRLEHEDYSFRSSIFGVNLTNSEDWERKVLVGIAWSSLARYYYFMTVSSWGTWHHQIHLGEAMSLPIRFPKDPDLRDEIVGLVNALLDWPVMHEQGYTKTQIDLDFLEEKLNNAIFKLYNLNNAERDLISDLCEFNLEFLYRHRKSRAAKSVEKYPRVPQGIISGLSGERERGMGLEGYLYAFLERWNKEIAPEGEFRWLVIRPSNVPMIAIVFSTQEVGDLLPIMGSNDDDEWYNVLDRCSTALRYPVSQRIYIDSMVRVVTETEIYIIKRDECRLWTRSMAREDAEATLVQAMFLQEETMKETV